MQPPSGQQPPTPGPGQPAMINLGNFNQDGTNKDGSPGRKMQRNSTGDAVNVDSNGNAELSEQEQKVQAEFRRAVMRSLLLSLLQPWRCCSWFAI